MRCCRLPSINELPSWKKVHVWFTIRELWILSGLWNGQNLPPLKTGQDPLPYSQGQGPTASVSRSHAIGWVRDKNDGSNCCTARRQQERLGSMRTHVWDLGFSRPELAPQLPTFVACACLLCPETWLSLSLKVGRSCEMFTGHGLVFMKWCLKKCFANIYVLQKYISVAIGD